MVRRRSGVRFSKGALNHKHEKRHLIRPRADGVAFLLLRLTTAVPGFVRLAAFNRRSNSVLRIIAWLGRVGGDVIFAGVA